MLLERRLIYRFSGFLVASSLSIEYPHQPFKIIPSYPPQLVLHPALTNSTQESAGRLAGRSNLTPPAAATLAWPTPCAEYLRIKLTATKKIEVLRGTSL